jgi:hypothetical protein
MLLTSQQRGIAARWRDRMAGVTAVFGLGSTLPPPVGPVCGGVAAGTGACAWVANRYANDPADPDFATAAIPSPPVVPTSRMREEMHAPATVIAFSDSLNHSYAYVSAALRAYERAQGARMRGDDGARTERLRETRRYARIAATHVAQLAERSEALATTFPEWIGEEFGRSAVAPRQPDDLPDTTLAFLYRAGVSLAALKRALDVVTSWSERQQVERPGEQLQELGPASHAFAGFLETWEPAVESSGGPSIPPNRRSERGGSSGSP